MTNVNYDVLDLQNTIVNNIEKLKEQLLIDINDAITSLKELGFNQWNFIIDGYQPFLSVVNTNSSFFVNFDFKTRQCGYCLDATALDGIDDDEDHPAITLFVKKARLLGDKYQFAFSQNFFEHFKAFSVRGAIEYHTSNNFSI